jgi:hypothetical protein
VKGGDTDTVTTGCYGVIDSCEYGIELCEAGGLKEKDDNDNNKKSST